MSITVSKIVKIILYITGLHHPVVVTAVLIMSAEKIACSPQPDNHQDLPDKLAFVKVKQEPTEENEIKVIIQ